MSHWRNGVPAVSAYPVQFDVEYPARRLARLTTLLRPLLIVPILVVLWALGGIAWDAKQSALTAGGVLFAAPLLMIVFRGKYPRWWFEFNQELLRFSNRVWVYGALLDDRYPSTDERQSLALDLSYPERPNRRVCHWSSGCSRSPTTSCCSCCTCWPSSPWSSRGSRS